MGNSRVLGSIEKLSGLGNRICAHCVSIIKDHLDGQVFLGFLAVPPDSAERQESALRRTYVGDFRRYLTRLWPMAEGGPQVLLGVGS